MYCETVVLVWYFAWVVTRGRVFFYVTPQYFTTSSSRFFHITSRALYQCLIIQQLLMTSIQQSIKNASGVGRVFLFQHFLKARPERDVAKFSRPVSLVAQQRTYGVNRRSQIRTKTKRTHPYQDQQRQQLGPVMKTTLRGLRRLALAPSMRFLLSRMA